MTIEQEILAIVNQIIPTIEKAFYDVFVMRHPGHGSQKVHGNRYGAGQAKESLRRLKDDKGEREKYKARARQKLGIAAKPARTPGRGKTGINSIKETPEMTKFQKQAWDEYESGRGVDISGVMLGWKIGGGPFDNNVIVNPSGTKKVKILKEVSDRRYKVDFNGKAGEISANQIATAIIKERWKVGTE